MPRFSRSRIARRRKSPARGFIQGTTASGFLFFLFSLLLLAFLLLPQCSGFLHASVTVNYTAQSGQRNVLDSEGNLLSEGHEVRIGFFAAGFDLEENADDLASLDSAWTTFDSTTIRPVQNLPSRFSRTSPGVCDPQFDGKPIFLWILKTVDGAPPRSDYSNVTEYGIFTSSASSWSFPLHNSPPGLNTTLINSNQVDRVPGGQGQLETNSLKLSPNSQPPELSYDLWEQSSFPAQSPEADRLRMADPDCDGIPNLLEYFSGSNPVQANVATGGIVISKGNARFTYRRSKLVPPESGKVQTSPDLTSWTDSDLQPQVIEDSQTHEILQLAIPLTPSGKAFVRLRVED